MSGVCLTMDLQAGGGRGGMLSQRRMLMSPAGYHLHVPMGLVGVPTGLAGLAILQYGSPRSEQDGHCTTGGTGDKAEDQSISNGQGKAQTPGLAQDKGAAVQGRLDGGLGLALVPANCISKGSRLLVLLQCVPALPSEVQALHLRCRNAG